MSLRIPCKHIGEWSVAPFILNFSTRWKLLVSFTPRKRTLGCQHTWKVERAWYRQCWWIIYKMNTVFWDRKPRLEACNTITTYTSGSKTFLSMAQNYKLHLSCNPHSTFTHLALHQIASDLLYEFKNIYDELYMQCGLCVLQYVHTYNDLSHQVCWIFRGWMNHQKALVCPSLIATLGLIIIDRYCNHHPAMQACK
jgi:hypothetical protein